MDRADIRRRYAPADGLRRGAYVLSDAPSGKPEVVLLASGSEVGLIVSAAEQLQAQNIEVRCVSMRSWKLFDDLSQADRDAVLPPSVGAVWRSRPAWRRAGIGTSAIRVTCSAWNASAHPRRAMRCSRNYGFTVDNVCARAQALLVRS